MLDELRACGYCDYGFFYPERTIPLHAMLINCGFSRRIDHEYIWNGLKRGPEPMIIWQYTLDGTGGLRYGHDEYRLPPGEALLVKVPEDHCYFLPAESPAWEFVYVTVNGSEAIRMLDELRGKTGPVCRFDSNAKTLPLVLELYHLARKKRINTPWQASRLAYDFVMTLAEDLLQAKDLLNQPVYLSEVIDFCVNNLHRRIDVEDMAALSGLSRFHFSREFKKHTGFSPAAYLQEMRMKKAVRMLQSERMTVKEIAYACGFDDASYFCRCFHQAYGMAPGNYREFAAPVATR